MSFSSSMSKVAERLINKYGSTVTLVHSENCHYDAHTGQQVCQELTKELKGAISSFTAQESLSPNVTQGDLSVLLQIDVDITRNEQIKYANKTWEIIDIVKTTAQDTTIVQRLQIRALRD